MLIESGIPHLSEKGYISLFCHSGKIKICLLIVRYSSISISAWNGITMLSKLGGKPEAIREGAW